MSKENDRQKADELLQKLHAAFLNDEKAEPVEGKEEPPAAKEQPQPTPKTEKKEKPAAPKKSESRPTEEPKSAAAPAAILALTEDAPDVTGENPVDDVKTENTTPATEEKTGSAQRKARPNTVKIPPRRRSGVNTGAIAHRLQKRLPGRRKRRFRQPRCNRIPAPEILPLRGQNPTVPFPPLQPIKVPCKRCRSPIFPSRCRPTHLR